MAGGHLLEALGQLLLGDLVFALQVGPAGLQLRDPPLESDRRFLVLLNLLGEAALASVQLLGAAPQLFLQGFTGFFSAGQGRLAIAQGLAVGSETLLQVGELGGSGLQHGGLLGLLGRASRALALALAQLGLLCRHLVLRFP
jgi:hypothetical protein